MSFSKPNADDDIGQYGQLGIGQKIYTVRKPTKSTWFTDHGIVIEKIACGFYHTLCLSTTGQLYVIVIAVIVLLLTHAYLVLHNPSDTPSVMDIMDN